MAGQLEWRGMETTLLIVAGCQPPASQTSSRRPASRLDPRHVSPYVATEGAVLLSVLSQPASSPPTGPECHSPAIGLHAPRPDHRPADALQPHHRPEGPSGRTVTACIVTHHRDLRCPGPTIGLHDPRPDHHPSDALQPDHRHEGPSGRTATACIVTHHRDLRCPGPTIGLQAPRPDHRPADALPTTGRRGHPPSAWPAQRMSPARPPAKPDHRLGRPPAQQK
ncbi:hypothetical protein Bbelb_099850, partial [Branchiostoma belcheri]